jgi:hypothetical protein
MPRLANEDLIVLDDESNDEISLYHRRPASIQSVYLESSLLEDVLVLDGSPDSDPDDSPDDFLDNIGEQTLNVEAEYFLPEDLTPAAAYTTFNDEPPVFDVLLSDNRFLTARDKLIVDLP